MVGVIRSRYLNDWVASTSSYCAGGRYYCRYRQPSPTEFAEGVSIITCLATEFVCAAKSCLRTRDLSVPLGGSQVESQTVALASKLIWVQVGQSVVWVMTAVEPSASV